MVRARGTCRICGYQGMLDPHHIISQAQCKKLGRLDLISNPGNVVHICRRCHDMTTASKVRKYLTAKEKKTSKSRGNLRDRTQAFVRGPKKAKKKAKPKKQPRCEAMTEMMDRCKHPAKPGEHVCGFHLRRRKPGFRRKW